MKTNKSRQNKPGTDESIAMILLHPNCASIHVHGNYVYTCNHPSDTCSMYAQSHYFTQWHLYNYYNNVRDMGAQPNVDNKGEN